MTPFHDTRAPRLDEGPAALDAWDTASIAGAASGIQTIAGLLLQHEADTGIEGDDLLQLSGASVSGLLEAVSGLAELIELRLGYGTHRAQQAHRQGGAA